MRRIILMFIVVSLVISIFSPVYATQLNSNKVKLEWDIAIKLIENYKQGKPQQPIKVDLNEFDYNKVYFYVYSIISERIYLEGNQSEGLWIASYKNQDIENSIERAKEIIKEIIMEDMSYLEKIATIHDYLISNTTFAEQEANAKTLTEDNIWAFSADGVFNRGSAVCSGYAAAMQILCEEADIPCYTVNSTAINHTWNIIYYDGAWRYIDVSTNDRADDSAGRNNMTSIYTYFLVNEDELSKTAHIFDESSQTTVSAKEYIDFLNYFSEKESPVNPKSIFIPTMEELANGGNMYAQYQLAYSYKVGARDVPIDYEKSFYWHYRAALRGHVPAQNNIGYFYEHALGVKQDDKKAFEWYMKAANNGNDVAQAHVGDCYTNGIGTAQNPTEARKWYQKAADNGNMYAAEILSGTVEVK